MKCDNIPSSSSSIKWEKKEIVLKWSEHLSSSSSTQLGGSHKNMAANGGKPWEVSKPASTCYFFFYSESKKSVLTEKGRASGLSWKKKIYIIFFFLLSKFFPTRNLVGAVEHVNVIRSLLLSTWVAFLLLLVGFISSLRNCWWCRRWSNSFLLGRIVRVTTWLWNNKREGGKKERNDWNRALARKPVDTESLRGDCWKVRIFSTRLPTQRSHTPRWIIIRQTGRQAGSWSRALKRRPWAVHPVTCHIVSCCFSLSLSGRDTQQTPLRLLASAKTTDDTLCVGVEGLYSRCQFTISSFVTEKEKRNPFCLDTE